MAVIVVEPTVVSVADVLMRAGLSIETKGSGTESVVVQFVLNESVTLHTGIPMTATASVIERAQVNFSVSGSTDIEISILLAPAGEFSAWMMNTRTGAMARYTNFPFTSLFRVGKSYYGIMDDGLYLLTGAKDGLSRIDAHAVSGLNDLGTHNLKHLPEAHAILRTDGEMSFSVIVDERCKVTYPVVGKEGQQGLHTKRISLAKGVKGSQVQIKLSNVDGADFDLAQIQLTVIPTRRT